jgi:hypothetical protein
MGAMGAMGATGATGAKGARGAIGATGATGAKGAMGATGARGATETAPGRAGARTATPVKDAVPSYEERKRHDADARRVKKAADARQKRIGDLEGRIAEREQAVRDLETTMAAPGFYDNHESVKPIVDRHQALMWEIGDLMHQWEELHQTKP